MTAAIGVAFLVAITANAVPSPLVGIGPPVSTVAYGLFAVIFGAAGASVLCARRPGAQDTGDSRVIFGIGFVVVMLGSIALGVLYQVEVSWKDLGLSAVYLSSMAAFFAMGAGFLIVAFGAGRRASRMPRVV